MSAGRGAPPVLSAPDDGQLTEHQPRNGSPSR